MKTWGPHLSNLKSIDYPALFVINTLAKIVDPDEAEEFKEMNDRNRELYDTYMKTPSSALGVLRNFIPVARPTQLGLKLCPHPLR